MPKTKVAFIGCGGIAETHLDQLLKIPDVQLVGFYTHRIEKAKLFAAKANQGTCYQSFLEMYDQAKPDAVYICTIPSAHGDFEIEAAHRGIHLFIEKPIGLSAELANHIADEVKKAGIITSVGYQERYLDIIDQAKDLLKERKIGLVQGSWLGDIPGVYWWRQKQLSGGQIVEQSTHIFDMLRYLIGEPTRVFCAAGTGIIENLPNYDIEDFSSAVINFKNNTIANVFTGCYRNSNLENPNGIKFYASDATIEYNLRNSIKITTSEKTEEHFNINDSVYAINRAFIEAIQTGNPAIIRSDYADAVKSLQFTLACNESIKNGIPVEIG